MKGKIKDVILQLLDESFYEVPIAVPKVTAFIKEFFPKATEHEIEAVIEELIKDGFLILGIAYGYERGIMSAKKIPEKPPLAYLKPILAKT
ncbi:hypothetical protein [Candidatus Borrarchaeum sp.]|uniref:hypothetical protein n=1 Tax=Candidatus Borrarchaeum sp. TaxID=2846742 RepID=UPI002579FF60|nr:hypothetical protein [Candidatus Borrarchaeum sp.]